MELHNPPKTGNYQLDVWLERLYEELMYVNNPVFFVAKSATQENFAVGEWVTVTFSTEIIDRGSNFSSNIFTAPVSGLYLLITSVYFLNIDSAASYYTISITTTNGTHIQTLDPSKFTGDVAYFCMPLAIIDNMDKGDTAQVAIYQNGGTQQTDIHAQTYFGGILLSR